MGGLKDELLKAIWHAFTALDLDRSGKVSKSQLKVSPLPALPVGHGTRGGVRREGWLEMWRGGGPPSSLFLQASGRCAGAGALLRLPRRRRCAPRGASSPAERPPATGSMGAWEHQARLQDAEQRPPRTPPPSRRPWADLGASESACRATRVLPAPCKGHCFCRVLLRASQRPQSVRYA